MSSLRSAWPQALHSQITSGQLHGLRVKAAAVKTGAEGAALEELEEKWTVWEERGALMQVLHRRRCRFGSDEDEGAFVMQF